MDIEVVTIGAELLLGHTVDTNAAALGRALASVGALVVRTTSVADDRDAIADAVRAALGRTGFVVATGGLGPTRDDVTKHAVAEVFRVPLVVDRDALARLEARWRALARPGPMPDANRTQAEVPAGATVLPNPRGTAPGLWLEGEPGTIVLLPGVPHEMRGLLADTVVPRVAARARHPYVITSRLLRTTGIAESALADRLRGIEAEIAPVTLAFLPTFDGTDLRLTAWRLPPGDADRALQRAVAAVSPLLGMHRYGEDGADLAAVLIAMLRDRGLTVTVAESCTGGLVGARLTAVPGASAVFLGGIIAYDNAVKQRDLAVPDHLIAAHGAVSEPVVQAMVQGATARFGAAAGVAVSGIAGPEGGTEEKPVGTVCLAAQVGDRVRTVRTGLPGDRAEIRARAAQAALDLLRRLLSPR